MAFGSSVTGITQRLQKRLEDRTRAVTREVFTKIVMRTPVYTGRARANWNVSYRSPNYRFTDSTSLSRALAQIDRLYTIPVGSIVYLTNGLPYIRLLEYGGYPKDPIKPTGRTIDGYSSQAPQGMVRITMAEYAGRI